MPLNQKGNATIIFITLILLVSIGIAGGSFYIKSRSPQLKKSQSENISSPQINTSPEASTLTQPFILPPGNKILSGPFYSPDHKHSALVVQTGDSLENSNFYVVYDNIPGKQYGNIVANIVFSQDSQKFAYVAGSKGGKDYVVIVNGQEIATYDHIYFPTFSPDGKRLAFTAFKGDKQLVVLDGKEGKQYEYIPDHLIFSPDSKLLAYHATAQKNTISYVVVGDKEIGPYDNVGNIIFSADSKEITFTAFKKARSSQTYTEKLIISSI